MAQPLQGKRAIGPHREVAKTLCALPKQRDMRAMIEQGIVKEEATSPTDPVKRYVFNEGKPGSELRQAVTWRYDRQRSLSIIFPRK